jgi:hypothetical protein
MCRRFMRFLLCAQNPITAAYALPYVVGPQTLGQKDACDVLLLTHNIMVKLTKLSSHRLLSSKTLYRSLSQ